MNKLLKCVEYKAKLEYTITPNKSGRTYWTTHGTIHHIISELVNKISVLGLVPLTINTPVI